MSDFLLIALIAALSAALAILVRYLFTRSAKATPPKTPAERRAKHRASSDPTEPQAPSRLQKDDPAADPRDRDAYFRYMLAQNLEDKEEGYRVLDAAQQFYLWNEGAKIGATDADVLRQIITQSRNIGFDILADGVEMQMHIWGKYVPQNDEIAFAAAQRAAAWTGDFHPAVVNGAAVAGHLLLTGRVKPFDKDLARDYLFNVFSVNLPPHDALKLAQIYTGIHDTVPDWPVAAAILKFAIFLSAEEGMPEPEKEARRELNRISARMTPEELRLAETYYAALDAFGSSADMFLKGIPHLEDARPLHTLVSGQTPASTGGAPPIARMCGNLCLRMVFIP